jgi:hypothetical protein
VRQARTAAVVTFATLAMAESVANQMCTTQAPGSRRWSRGLSCSSTTLEGVNAYSRR